MVFVVYTMEEDFGIFVVYTMEGDFRILWCTPWKGKMVFVVYTVDLKMVSVVYTMAEDFGIFVVHIMEWDFRISWCTWKAKNGFHGVHHGS